ncbi:MAG: hypothetical protein ACFFB3_01870 [Candidatus Hodarchaeota archaeon]
MALVRFADVGPLPVCSEKIPFLETKSTDEAAIILTIQSALYFTVLGQTDMFFVGQYGPMPVQSAEEYLANIQAFFVPDPASRDLRMRRKAYCALLIFYPRSFRPNFNQYEDHLTDYFETLTVKDLGPETLAKVRRIVDGANEPLFNEQIIKKTKDLQAAGRPYEIIVVDELEQQKSFRWLLKVFAGALTDANINDGKITIPPGQIRITSKINFQKLGEIVGSGALIYCAMPNGKDTSGIAQELISKINPQISTCLIRFRNDIPVKPNEIESSLTSGSRSLKVFNCCIEENRKVTLLRAVLSCFEEFSKMQIDHH